MPFTSHYTYLLPTVGVPLSLLRSSLFLFHNANLRINNDVSNNTSLIFEK